MFNRVHFPLKFQAIPLVIVFALLVLSCGKAPVSMVDCSGLNPTYTTDIKPILNASCAIPGCHDSFSQQWGYDFSKYNTAKEISQGDRFLGAIQGQRGYYTMPLGGKLSTTSIDLLTCWVQDGSQQ